MGTVPSLSHPTGTSIGAIVTFVTLQGWQNAPRKEN